MTDLCPSPLPPLQDSLPSTPTLPHGSVTSPTLLTKPFLQDNTSLSRTATIQRSIRASEPDSVQIPGLGARDAVSMTDLSGEVTGRGLGAGRVGSMGSFLQQLRGAGEKGSLLGWGSSSFSQASVGQQVKCHNGCEGEGIPILLVFSPLPFSVFLPNFILS